MLLCCTKLFTNICTKVLQFGLKRFIILIRTASPDIQEVQKMTKQEMIVNVKELAIPALHVTINMSMDELNETVRNVMFERFISEVVCDSELCGVSPMESRKFAIDFIQNSDYVKNCLTATINLVLNGAFTKKWQLNNFVDKLLYVHVVKACHEKLGNHGCISVTAI